MRELSLPFYDRAKLAVFDAGYGSEYEWQASRAESQIDEREFLREYAWVVLNCGFRESTVRKMFPFISLAFFDYTSAREIVDQASDCIAVAATRFSNIKKLQAIVVAAETLTAYESAESVLHLIAEKPEDIDLPYIGAVTRNHLLKNLGIPVAKNDRHLARISEIFGFADAQHLCEYISEWTGEAVPLVDIVLWRFATLPEGRTFMRTVN